MSIPKWIHPKSPELTSAKTASWRQWTFCAYSCVRFQVINSNGSVPSQDLSNISIIAYPTLESDCMRSGRDLFGQKFRNFPNGTVFSVTFISKIGQPLKVFHFSEISEISCSIWHSISVTKSGRYPFRQKFGFELPKFPGAKVENNIPFSTREFRKFKPEFSPKWIAPFETYCDLFELASDINAICPFPTSGSILTLYSCVLSPDLF